MSIEERLVRDVAAATAGVVVTDADLSAAQLALALRLEGSRHRQRRRDRRRAVVALAAGVVLLLVVGIASLRSMRDETRTAPPVNPGPTDNGPTYGFLVGSAPLPEEIHGVWRVDDGTTSVRFSPSGAFSMDADGLLVDNPAVRGTYELVGDRVTVRVEGGTGGCAGTRIVMHASIPPTGGLRLWHSEPGQLGCTPEKGGRWVMEKMLPPVSAFVADEFSSQTGWQPLVSVAALHGVWLAEGARHVLEIDPDGSYYVLDASTEPVDQGKWSLRGTDLTLTSSARSARCAKGDQLVLADVEQVDPGTRAFRYTARQNTCGADWVPASWFLIPYTGS